MTLVEILKAQGLSDDQIKTITDSMKENKVYTASEENLDVRYGKLKTDHDALVASHAESTKLIEELQKATAGQEDVQKKITEYEQTIAQQAEELEEAKADSALKIGLLSSGAKASDIDYLIFKMKNDSDFKVELDDNGQVKGLDEKVKGLKTQFPNQFEGSSSKKVDEKKLPNKEGKESDVKITKEDFKKMGYKSRVELREKDPELYKELSK